MSIFDRALLMYSGDKHFNSSHIIKKMMEIGGYESVFELLQSERIRILKEADQMLEEGVSPVFTWQLKQLKGNVYWDTEPFVVENNHWILNFSYFSSTDDALKICIKMCKNPFEDTKKKYYQ